MVEGLRGNICQEKKRGQRKMGKTIYTLKVSLTLRWRMECKQVRIFQTECKTVLFNIHTIEQYH